MNKSTGLKPDPEGIDPKTEKGCTKERLRNDPSGNDFSMA